MLHSCTTFALPRHCIAALAATEPQFCQHSLKLSLCWVLQLLRLAQLHHGIKDHLCPTSPPLFSRSPTLLILGQRSSRPRRPCEDSFVVNNDESIPEWEWTLGAQTGQWEQSQTTCPVPSSIDLFTPLLGHHPMVTSLLDWSEVIIRLMKDGDVERTFELGPIVTMSCHPWNSNTKNKTHQIPPVPCMPHKQTPRQPTPGPSGTRWSEDLSREPSQHNEPPIPGLSPSSKPPEDVLTCKPEPEVAPTQSTEDLFACPTTPCSVIIIDDMPGDPHLPLV
ncbi:hypothetical protein O181_039377 [Austropuccinia psidii MF-1]|uniref:Uncharacterized protein n=1 Tax=Austropuccinia psidii MF-1 TaxID=1389203 RepID=A0A9Q3HCV2_9BASI|nr:hypothetical protein [Austropuccinia psidii MF-1]